MWELFLGTNERIIRPGRLGCASVDRKNEGDGIVSSFSII